MKIRHTEYIRLAVMASYIAASSFTNLDDTLLKQVNETLLNNNISIEDITPFLNASNTIMFLTGFKLEQLTKDYESIEVNYRHILYNLTEVVEELGIKDEPIKVFALFTYLYRNGYLSYNKQFKYSTNMKDLPYLQGVDVVRGYGVCRSISSMFTDLCDMLDYTATNVAVKATSTGLAKKEQLCPTDLQTEERGRKFAKMVGKITQYLPIGNHLVTHVHTSKVTGIFDPTNDIFMEITTGKRYTFANDSTATMSHSFISNFASVLLSSSDTEVLPMDLSKHSRIPKISYEEYKREYEEALQLIKASEPLLEALYEVNKRFYERIEELTKNQHGMIKRVFPIIPTIKRKNK